MDLEHKFSCTECEKRFTMRHVLRDHMKSIHDMDTEIKGVFSCEICENVYHDSGSFRRHTKTDHTISCPSCDKRFTKEKYLNLHTQSFHSEEISLTNAYIEKMIPHLISIDAIYESLNFVKTHDLDYYEEEEEEEEEIECPFDKEVYEQIDAVYDYNTQALFEPQIDIDETVI